MTSKSEETQKQELRLTYLFDHGVDFRNRTIRLSPDTGDHTDDNQHEIMPDSFALVDSAISEMESINRRAITIKIHSWGGCVKTALAIIGRFEASKCKIITEGYGTIESAATLILASGDERRISKRATFMHHEASYTFEGRHSQAKAYVEQAEMEEKLWAEAMSEFSKKKAEFYRYHGEYIDAWWTPEQLLEYGLVDKIF